MRRAGSRLSVTGPLFCLGEGILVAGGHIPLHCHRGAVVCQRRLWLYLPAHERACVVPCLEAWHTLWERLGAPAPIVLSFSGPTSRLDVCRHGAKAPCTCLFRRGILGAGGAQAALP